MTIKQVFHVMKLKSIKQSFIIFVSLFLLQVHWVLIKSLTGHYTCTFQEDNSIPGPIITLSGQLQKPIQDHYTQLKPRTFFQINSIPTLSGINRAILLG